MNTVKQNLTVHLEYSLSFTQHSFDVSNTLLRDILAQGHTSPVKVLVIIDSGVTDANSAFRHQVIEYFNHYQDTLTLVQHPMILTGGEGVKNSYDNVEKVYQAIHEGKICRHSYVVVVGGGAILDLVGFTASTAHRGVRLVRLPTTVLSQDDSGIGVKNGFNLFGKKNFIGAFSVPYAVINDIEFLKTLDMRDWRSGTAEAVKVALIKDAAFFEELEKTAVALNAREMKPMESLIRKCAALHMDHIANSGDPFEITSSRPLDFGHWSAHKLESMTHYELKHGEAVAIGIALDCIYGYLSAYTDKATCLRVLVTLQNLGFDLYHDAFEILNPDTHMPYVLDGLSEFREHLGGELTISMLSEMGKRFDIHEVDLARYCTAIEALKQYVNTQRL